MSPQNLMALRAEIDKLSYEELEPYILFRKGVPK
jgi:hypothetical protein